MRMNEKNTTQKGRSEVVEVVDKMVNPGIFGQQRYFLVCLGEGNSNGETNGEIFFEVPREVYDGTRFGDRVYLEVYDFGKKYSRVLGDNSLQTQGNLYTHVGGLTN